MSVERRARVVAERPRPGIPRPYEFPDFERGRLAGGLTVLSVHLPGRPVVSASLVVRHGAVDEPAERGGATVLAARALTEGTERRDAIALTEAAERLGASLHAEAGWDALSVGVDVPAARLEPALELLAEVVQLPSFPAAEVDRLRDERLNDILQARADPRRRADEAFVERIYTPDSPYHRPAAGLPETVAPLGSRHLREAYEGGLDPARAVLVVGGDLSGLDVPALADRLFGTWRGSERAGPARPIVARSAVRERVVHVVHRPGAVQTEVRVGHVGLPRRIPDFHALSLMSAILGGLFNSRLNMKLREERGYTYGAGASFDLRRGPGPFSARAAVHTAATVPAVLDILVELERMRDAPVGEDELRAARDFLVGVFPLRFETPGPVVAALSGLFVHELPDDELRRYRGAIEAVTIDDVLQAARTRLRLEELAIVLVGDVDAFGAELEAARIGPVEVERDVGPRTEGPLEGVEEELGPVDEQEDVGPAPGAREPPDEADEEPADVDLGAEELTGGPS